MFVVGGGGDAVYALVWAVAAAYSDGGGGSEGEVGNAVAAAVDTAPRARYAAVASLNLPIPTPTLPWRDGADGAPAKRSGLVRAAALVMVCMLAAPAPVVLLLCVGSAWLLVYVEATAAYCCCCC